MPCSALKVNRRFGGIYRLHLQGRKQTKQETSVKKVESKAVNLRFTGRCCWYRRLWPGMRNCADVYLGGGAQRKTTKNISKDSRSSERDLNPRPPE
jgi:hypothetical protein